MNLFLVFLILISIIDINIYLKKFNKKYLTKDNTNAVKGIFILIVFCSHIKQYIPYNNKLLDSFMMNNIVIFLGQLMVTMFLFYSGYGIYESIKKKDNYIKDFPKKRILKTLLSYDFCVMLYLIIYLILKNKFTLKKLFLYLIGWLNFGNSNWYIFCILVLYLITYLSFKVFKNNKKAIVSTLFLTILFYIFLKNTQPSYWRNTLFCYNLGMIYSYNKDKIEKFILKNSRYLLILLFMIIIFSLLYKIKTLNVLYFDLLSLVFVIIIVLISLKININSPILKWFGDNLFWVYILQRIPMIILSSVGYQSHKYRYFIICFIVTILLTIIVKKIYSLFEKLLDKIIINLKKKISFTK